MNTVATNRSLLAKVLSPKQSQAIVACVDGPELVTLLTGAVSGGKTFSTLIALFAKIPKAPTNALIVFVGRSLLTLERNILDPLRSVEMFGDLARQVHYTAGSSTAVIMGRTIHLIGANNALAEGRIRGATIGLAYVDEATLIPKSFWMMLMSRLRVPHAKCIATTNPDSSNHWMRKDFILRADLVGMRVIQFLLDDNPYLTTEYVERLKAQYVGLWYRRYILGEWSMAEGAIFDMFDPDRHVIHGDLPPMITYPGVGVDYGTTNPFSAHLLGVQANNQGVARLVLAREFRHDPRLANTQLTDGDFSKRLRAWMGEGPTPRWVAVDPSAASFKLQLFRDGVSNVIDANNKVLDSIRLVASLLAGNRLVIHESCTGLLEEIPGFSWDPVKAEKGIDAPIKADDHSVDSSRYAVASTETLWRPYVPSTLSPAMAA